MSIGLLAVVVVLAEIGAIPAGAVTRWRPVTIFLAPLVGALECALAAVCELEFPGTFTVWLVVVAAATNLLGIGVLWHYRLEESALRRRQRSRSLPAALGILAVAVAAFFPLWALRARIIGYDTNAIWLLHGLFIFGGHHVLAPALHNAAYNYSNLDYPPLVPAGSAFSFWLTGGTNFVLAVGVTAALNACALGVVACGVIAAAGPKPRVGARVVSILAAVAVCLTGFGVSGTFAVIGYADLLWAATATAAVVYGLILPRSRGNLAVAWLCLTMAALTKNEGLTTALVLCVLLAFRYVTPALAGAHAPGLRRAGAPLLPTAVEPAVRRLLARGALAGLFAIPGASWTILVRLAGVQNDFFLGPIAGTPLDRIAPALAGVSHQLVVLPIAAVVMVAGTLTLRWRRSNLTLGGAGWLWVAGLVSLAIVLGTYIFGSPTIHWWLRTSVTRTTIFTRLLFSTDIALWLVIAMSSVTRTPPSPALDRASLDRASLDASLDASVGASAGVGSGTPR